MKSGLSVYHVRLASHRGSGQKSSVPPLVTDMIKVGQYQIRRLLSYFSKFYGPENVSVSLPREKSGKCYHITAVSYEILP